MEAQRIITISINKIAGSRNQRGGINLRKNLLVASVLQSARTLYYEEMCNKMSRTTTLYTRCDSEMDDEDCTESPDWGDNDNDSSPSCEQENNAPAGNAECSTPISTGNEDKENRIPDFITPVVDTLEPVKCERIEQVEDLKSVESCEDSNERPVLRDLSSQNYSCFTCKRKRNDDDVSCDSYVPVKKAKVDSDSCYSHSESQESTQHEQQGNITSLVCIFKSGFHGLSGDSNRNSNASTEQNSNVNRSAMSSHLEQSSYVSPIARSLDILSRPIAAC